MTTETTKKAGVPRAAIVAAWMLTLVAALAIGAMLRGGGEPGSGEGPPPAAAGSTMWTCAMDPHIRLPEPGPCPACGMDLIPVQAGGGSGPVLELSEEAAKLADIETSAVERRTVTAEIRMVGKVEFDETRLAYITSWVSGRLDRLYVDYTGVPVRKGDHLVYMYSPEVRTAQAELIRNHATYRQHQAQLEEGKIAEGQVLASLQNLDAAREKLRLWGLTPEQIAEIEERGTPSDHITIYAPIGGVVIEKNAIEGMYVETGSRIYTIADLTHLWVKLDAYESDLQWVRYGQDVEFRTEAYPGRVFRGQIAFIDPVLDDRTRTVKVRVNVTNPDRSLKPGMFVRALVRAQVAGAGHVLDPKLAGKWICPMHPEVIADGAAKCDLCGMDLVEATELGYDAPQDAEPSLVIPASAPLITGERAVVYVRRPDAETPTFEGREVVLGPRAGGHYIVESGLEEGEEVVTRGNFKIDSSLQIQAKPSMMNPEGGGPPPGHDHGGAGAGRAGEEAGEASVGEAPEAAEPVEVGPERIQGVLHLYLGVHEALFAKDDAAARESAQNLQSLLKATADLGDGTSEVWTPIRNDLLRRAATFLEARGIAAQREAFPELSRAMGDLLAALSWKGRPEVHRMHCPMALGMGRGADWYQRSADVENPFFGKGEAMESCGTLEATLGGGGE